MSEAGLRAFAVLRNQSLWAAVQDSRAGRTLAAGGAWSEEFPGSSCPGVAES